VRERLQPKQGACRAHAPTMHLIPTPQGLITQGGWPPVTEDGWCGEYRGKTDENITFTPFKKFEDA